MVAIVGAMLTLVIAAWSQNLVEQRTHERFARLADQTVLNTQNRLDTYVALLNGASGLFSASDEVTEAEFARYAAQLELERRYPGVQGLGYAARIDRRAPRHPGRMLSALPAGVRPWPGPSPESAIVYLLPKDRRNRAALGFDMMSEPIRREAMDRARDLGVPAASGRVVLVQELDHDKQPGFLIYTPVYARGSTPETVADRRADLIGWVYSPFRAHDLFRQVFAGTGLLDQVDVEVFDAAAGEAGLLFSSPTVESRRPSRFRVERRLDVAGRTWVMQLRANEGFPAPPWWRTALPILLAGFALTATSAAAARAQANGLARAQAAETEALRAKSKAEFLLREVNHRVANSLQLVSSLVALQAEAVKDPGARAALQDTRARILAVGRVHQRLYGDDGAGHVDLKAYLQHLVVELAESLEGAGPRLQFRGEREVLVDADMAVGVGVAVAELVTNAAKYAYPDGRPGEIRVRLEPHGPRLEVCVEDDGVGMAPGAKPAGSGLGMKVVRAMAADLTADLEVGSGPDGGLRVSLIFVPKRQG
ncbi:CHASE domain-containing protein [Caulobacter sp. 17J80-11]|uniref:CHASE domain-containing protein n=1 Tax=Caulobacter sp. 17J80-11 TaxID=2763502 RepID=UPI001653E07B|nr:CHASE domain-containing protein [Caulobacter sp. 17J80-11]